MEETKALATHGFHRGPGWLWCVAPWTWLCVCISSNLDRDRRWMATNERCSSRGSRRGTRRGGANAVNFYGRVGSTYFSEGDISRCINLCVVCCWLVVCADILYQPFLFFYGLRHLQLTYSSIRGCSYLLLWNVPPRLTNKLPIVPYQDLDYIISPCVAPVARSLTSSIRHWLSTSFGNSRRQSAQSFRPKIYLPPGHQVLEVIAYRLLTHI